MIFEMETYKYSCMMITVGQYVNCGSNKAFAKDFRVTSRLYLSLYNC